MKDKLKKVKISEIILDDRFRVDMGDLELLKESIKEKGILQPITLSMDLHLLAGGRRYAACLDLGIKEIPALLREITGELDSREIELIENTHRKEFTWDEKAKLVERIHTLKKENDVNWSGAKTANLLAQSPMSISRSLKLAAGLEALPELKECKTADEAMGAIKKIEEDLVVQELNKRQQTLVEKVSKNHPGINNLEKGIAASLHVANNNYIIGDVFKHLKSIKKTNGFDLIECDPPYGISLTELTDKNRDNLHKVETYQEIPENKYPAFLKKITEETYKVAAGDSWMIFWFDFRYYSSVVENLILSGWKLDTIPVIWKKSPGITPNSNIFLSRSYEAFFICRKGSPIIHKKGAPNLFESQIDNKKIHPTQRPVQLMKNILNVLLDDTLHSVLVPFAGSGNTLRACYALGYDVLGFDINPEYKDKFLLNVEEDTRKEFT